MHKPLRVASAAGLLATAACVSFGVMQPAKAQQTQSYFVDCPPGIEDAAPARFVMKYVGEQLLSWREYEVGERGTCVVQSGPRGALDADAAEAFQSFAFEPPQKAIPEGLRETLSLDDPALNLPLNDAPPVDLYQSTESLRLTDDQKRREDTAAGGPIRLDVEDVIGNTDERTLVEDTQVPRYRSIGYATNTYPTGWRGRCTATIVSPYVALTNGHCVYNIRRGGYAIEFKLAPSQFVEQDNVIRPYGTFTATAIKTNDQYISDEQAEVDYAAIFFAKPFTEAGITNYPAIVFDMKAEKSQEIRVTGYPKRVRGDNNSVAMWTDTGTRTTYHGRIVQHYADTTGGQSGSLVVSDVIPGLANAAIALHCCGPDTGFNTGPWFGSHNQSVLQNWLEWKPRDATVAITE